MTPPDPPEPMTEAEFEECLHRLITDARDRNAPLYGSFTVRSPDPDAQDYDVQITPVTNRTPG